VSRINFYSNNEIRERGGDLYGTVVTLLNFNEKIYFTSCFVPSSRSEISLVPVVLFLPEIVFAASNFRAVFCARREARPSALVSVRRFSSGSELGLTAQARQLPVTPFVCSVCSVSAATVGDRAQAFFRFSCRRTIF
jgi:hypothetical protein